MMMGFADLPIETLKALKIHPDAAKKKQGEIEQGDADAGAGPSTAMVPTGGSSKGSSISRKPVPSNNTSSDSLYDDRSDVAGSTLASRTDSNRDASSVTSPSDITPINSPPLKPTDPGSHSASLAQALNVASRDGKRPSSRGSSPSRAHSGSGTQSPRTGTDYMKTALGTGKGIQRIVGAGLKSPLDFSMGLAKGFHNAPKLYGDEVRQVDKVTGFNSGMKTAAKEFGLGFYDGLSGLVTQPLKGARKEGAAGFLKGVGMGVGGLVLKPGAAIYGIPAYTMKGIHAEIQKQYGASTNNYIIAARTAQGLEELQSLSRDQRAEI
ncbi:hypothetical protein LTS18_001007, partial [Coniosporium uncinatum]